MSRYYVKTPDNADDPRTVFVRHTRHLYKDFGRACRTAARNLGRVYDDENKLMADFWASPTPKPEAKVSKMRRVEVALFMNAT